METYIRKEVIRNDLDLCLRCDHVRDGDAIYGRESVNGNLTMEIREEGENTDGRVEYD